MTIDWKYGIILSVNKYVFCECGNKRHVQSKSNLCRKCWLDNKRATSKYLNNKIRGGSQWKNQDGQKHYELNREVYIEKASKRRKDNWKKLADYKKTLTCQACGIKDYRILDFDHPPGTKNGKKSEVSSLANRGWSWENILLEIKKCDPVCSNCHRIRTWNRKNGKVA